MLPVIYYKSSTRAGQLQMLEAIDHDIEYGAPFCYQSLLPSKMKTMMKNLEYGDVDVAALMAGGPAKGYILEPSKNIAI